MKNVDSLVERQLSHVLLSPGIEVVGLPYLVSERLKMLILEL